MAAKPNSRNWNDVQTAIATVAIVSSLGLWNLFAMPSKTKVAQTSEPEIPPTEPPVEVAAEVPAMATAMPQIKIMFTPGATPTVVVQQVQNNNQQVPTKKKKRDKTAHTGGGGPVTTTKTS